MKITQEVRDFAAKQARSAAERPGDVSQADLASEASAGSLRAEDAEQGMAEMSKRFEESGGELYVPATE